MFFLNNMILLFFLILQKVYSDTIDQNQFCSMECNYISVTSAIWKSKYSWLPKRSLNVTEKISNWCKNISDCKFHVDYIYLGDPCSRIIQKHLNIEYSCGNDNL